MTAGATAAEQQARHEHGQREALAGTGLVLASGLGFGAVVVLARIAFDGGSNAPTSLAVRFALAGAVLWGILLARGRARALPARRVAGFALMGLFFSGSSTASFIAVERIPASLVALVFYIYPAIVTAGAALLYGARFSRARLAVLAASLLGCALTVDLRAGPLDGLGVAVAIASAFFYSGYILVASRATRGVPAMNASAWVISTAALVMLLVGASGVLGEGLTTAITPGGWAALLGLALCSTVIAISAFLAGLARLDIFRAAILSTFEPVVSVALAALLLGERLTAQQGLGGLLIVGAAVALQLIARRELAAAMQGGG